MKLKALSPKEKFLKVKKLREEGKSRAEIEETLRINKNTLNNVITTIGKGFNYHYEYQGYLARQKGFSSQHEYQEHLARKGGYKNTQRARMAFHKLKRPIELLNKDAIRSGYKDFNSYISIRRMLKRTAPIGTTPKQQELEDSIILFPPKTLEQTLVAPVENKNNQYDIEIIKILIQKLPERERNIIEKKYFQGKTLEEIGKEYGITGEGVRQIQYFTLNTLREIYEMIFVRKPSLHKQTSPF